MREGDFHPVLRTVEFRDSGNVQIAELDYDVLPWSKSDPSWFEPSVPLLPSTSHGFRMDHSNGLRGLPVDLSPEQLDLAELETRVALSHLNADANERIELVRAGTGIQVKGIVATAARKQEIERGLRQLPHVMAAIYTFDEMQNLSSPGGQITSIASSTVSESISPLQTYLSARGWTKDSMGTLSQDLFIQSATIERENIALVELESRFAAPGKLTDPGRAALDELLSHHLELLKSALSEEQKLLTKLGVANLTEASNSAGSGANDPAKKNRMLCNELLAGAAEQPRSAETIVTEMAASLNEIRQEVARDDRHHEPQARLDYSTHHHSRKAIGRKITCT